jgi:sugar O-acyltransferase (sialic acid O-acetyltransferase NeuD family)
MKKPLLIYGAGGLGSEVLSLIYAIEDWEVIGFIDDKLPAETIVSDVHVLGGLESLVKLKGKLNLVLAIGNPAVKKQLFNRLKNDSRIEFPELIHPLAVLQDRKTISIGPGSIITAGSILTTNITIQEFVLVNLNATIGHDSVISKFSSIMPGVNIAGKVVIGEEVLVGSGANLINGIAIGNRATVGIGSVVLKNVESDTTVVGVPAKPLLK